MATELHTWEDERLMEGVLAGHHPAFAELVRRHSKKFYALAYRSVFRKDEAEDIVQDAFLKLWDNPHSWNPARGAKFTTWFYRIVVNMCLDANKKKRPLPLEPELDMPDGQDSAEMLLEQKQCRALIDSGVAALPARQRIALNLCFYEGLSHQEAAQIMGLPIKALQSLLMRAKTTLKETMKPYLKQEVA